MESGLKGRLIVRSTCNQSSTHNRNETTGTQFTTERVRRVAIDREWKEYQGDGVYLKNVTVDNHKLSAAYLSETWTRAKFRRAADLNRSSEKPDCKSMDKLDLNIWERRRKADAKQHKEELLNPTMQILVKVVKDNNEHLASFRFEGYKTLEDITETFKRVFPMLHVRAKSMTVEQLTFPFELNGVKVQQNKKV